jgi:hypothetical protein
MHACTSAHLCAPSGCQCIRMYSDVCGYVRMYADGWMRLCLIFVCICAAACTFLVSCICACNACILFSLSVHACMHVHTCAPSPACACMHPSMREDEPQRFHMQPLQTRPCMHACVACACMYTIREMYTQHACTYTLVICVCICVCARACAASVHVRGRSVTSVHAHAYMLPVYSACMHVYAWIRPCAHWKQRAWRRTHACTCTCIRACMGMHATVDARNGEGAEVCTCMHACMYTKTETVACVACACMYTIREMYTQHACTYTLVQSAQWKRAACMPARAHTCVRAGEPEWVPMYADVCGCVRMDAAVPYLRMHLCMRLQVSMCMYEGARLQVCMRMHTCFRL